MFQRILGIMMLIVLVTATGYSQNINKQLDAAVQKLSTDEQFKHAIIGMYVIDGKTGAVVFDKNSQLGLAPASCQKIITSVSAFEILGKEFQYKTYIGYDLQINKGALNGNLYLSGAGDPTPGSSRWGSSSEEMILKKLLSILQKNKIKSIKGDLVVDDASFTNEPLPGGWVWEDIGNYYGAGAWGFNWKENQFDVTFKTGAPGDNTEIISTDPAAMLKDYTFANFVKTGGIGTGDNGYLFTAPFHQNIIARGTLPPSKNRFTISGSMPDPPTTFVKRLKEYLDENSVAVTGSVWTSSARLINNKAFKIQPIVLDSILSPPLDSINYWFLKKSVNLFGEALVKTMAYKKNKYGSTDSGIALIKEFWSGHGIEKPALKMIDGSGLSPANRITAHSLVIALQYAQKRTWFSSFYNALPETNGIKMKDGYITGVRSYAGYLKSKKGTDYIFAFIVNNFDGSPGAAREKMWKILDLLKDN